MWAAFTGDDENRRLLEGMMQKPALITAADKIGQALYHYQNAHIGRQAANAAP